MTADELLTKGDLDKAIDGLKNELLEALQGMLKGSSDPVYNTAEAAKLIKCSKASIRRRAANGEIAFSRDGTDLKFLESDLMAYLKKNRVKTMDECMSEARRGHRH